MATASVEEDSAEVATEVATATHQEGTLIEDTMEILLLFVLFIVRCGSLISPYRLLAIIRKILPVPIQRQKPRKYIGKMPCLKLTPGKGKPISYYLLEQLSVQGFACLYFTNISIRYSAIKVPVLSVLLYIYFLAPFLSFIYYLIYIAPFSLSIVKDHRGVSFTSFKYLFQLAAESCML